MRELCNRLFGSLERTFLVDCCFSVVIFGCFRVPHYRATYAVSLFVYGAWMSVRMVFMFLGFPVILQ